MKKFITLTVFLCFFATLFGQKSATQDLVKFSNLVIIGNFTVDILPSAENIAIAESGSEEVDVEKLVFSYTGETLTIKYTGSFVKDIDLNLTLHYSGQISSIVARRGAEITQLDAGKFENVVEYRVETGGKILIRNVVAEKIDASISKGGSIRLIGETNNLEASVKAGGTIATANLRSTNVVASVSLGGEIICLAEETLVAKVTSGGTISYTGKPKVEQTIKLGGTIEQL